MNDARTLDCGHPPSSHETFTTGYGRDDDGKTYCYDCCAARDRATMRADGRITLYVSEDKFYPSGHVVSNWPGSLKIGADRAKVLRHGGGFGAQRTDVWFTFEGQRWHGVNRGDNMLVRCRRIAR